MLSTRKLLLALCLLGATSATTTFLVADDASKASSTATDNSAKGELVPPTEKDAAWVASQEAVYPVKTCLVSGDELGGDMGKPIDYIYRVKGQPDRLIRFCCKDCRKDFMKDPASYLTKLDAAAKKAKDAGTR